MKIKIWDPENGDEEDADEVSVSDSYLYPDLSWVLAREAEDWMEEHHPDNDYPETQRVNVRVTEHSFVSLDQTLWEFEVRVEMRPTFRAAIARG